MRVIEGVNGVEIEVRTCMQCGDELDDVEWLFDPCPEDSEGVHREAGGGRIAAAFRAVRAVWGFARSHSPGWLVPVLAVAVLVPGPFDELAVILVVLVPVLRSREARRELGESVRDAWKG